ncbi:MAG: hypothetical protein AVDCRST_MAG72-1595, partial [uncultured Nocardioidaceae bacterium]
TWSRVTSSRWLTPSPRYDGASPTSVPAPPPPPSGSPAP